MLDPRATWLFCVALGSACCYSGPRVPQGTGAAPIVEDVRLFDGPIDGALAVPPLDVPPAMAPSIEGMALPLAPGASLRAGLALDVDFDLDRDVVAVVTAGAPATADGGPTGPEELVLFVRSPTGFEPPRTLMAVPTPAGCAEEPSIAQSSRGSVVVRFAASCPGGAPGAPSRAFVVVEVLSLVRGLASRAGGTFDAALLETGFGTISGPYGTVDLGATTGDRDQDGADDVAFRIEVRGWSGEGGDAVALELPYIDRPGGIVPDLAEPERSLRSIAARARNRLARNPSDAALLARGILVLDRLLCGPQGRAALVLRGVPPPRCAPMPVVAEAAALAVRALIRAGRAPQAYALKASFDPARIVLGPADRTALDAEVGRAIGGGVSAAARRIEGVQLVRPVALLPAHLPLLRFIDDDRFLVLGAEPRVVSLSGGGAVEPAAADAFDGDLRIRSPNGQFVVFSVVERCGEDRALLCPAAGYCPPGGAWSVRLTGRRGTESTCGPAAEQRVGRADLRVLGWHPDGWLLVADGARLREVRVNLQRHTSQPPRDVRTPPSALLAGSAFSIDAALWAMSDSNGIWIRRATATAGRDAPPPAFTLLRPAGLPVPYEAFSDFAWAPSGRRFAAVRNGEVWVFDLSGQLTAPPAPAAPAAPTPGP